MNTLYLGCLLLMVLFQVGLSEIKTAPEKGENVCAYDRTKVVYKMRRSSITLVKTSTSKKCNMPGYRNMMCRETKYERRVYWYPERSERRYVAYDCCPGWQGYKKRVGCLQVKTCPVKIPQKSSAECRAEGEKVLAGVRKIYKLGTVGNLPLPVTDMDAKTLIGMHMKDPFTAEWMKVYIGMLHATTAIHKAFLDVTQKEFTSIKDYENVNSFFITKIKSVPQIGKFFRFPFDSMPFKNVINNHTWREDSMFAEMRLAGLNPMCIQRLTFSEDVGVSWSKLSGRLNADFDWNKAIQKAFGRPSTMQRIIGSGSVFVCQHPLFDDLINVPDLTESRPTRKMWKSTSPIAVFVSRYEGKGRQLIPAAIQMDSKKDSSVYTPESGDLWMLAKKAFEVTDLAYLDMVEHLLMTHLMMEPFCVTIRRTLSPLHPIQQIMKYHCRGILANNKIGFPKLVNDKAYMHKLFAIGNKGALQLLVKAYQIMTWQDTDFLYNIKRRGLDDKRTLPYFPYRDDGKVLYRSIYDFVKEYIKNYYRTDVDVMEDNQLQALANEMSSEGTGEDGGKGKLRGFPSQIKSRFILMDTLTRLIWTTSGQHSAVNYPVPAYGAFTPLAPTKIYDDERVPNDKFNLFRLPNGNISAIQAFTAVSYGTLHYDDLLDYGPKLTDVKGSNIVKKHYRRLVNQVKNKMDIRNRERYDDGHLTYPFFTPGWVPNSICT